MQVRIRARCPCLSSGSDRDCDLYEHITMPAAYFDTVDGPIEVPRKANDPVSLRNCKPW